MPLPLAADGGKAPKARWRRLSITTGRAHLAGGGRRADRVDDTVTMKAYSGTVGDATEEASRSFVVADAHALPAPAAVTVEARDASGRAVTSVSEGGAVELTVSVDRSRGAATATGEALSA